ncbi:MAG: hypothetical protein K2M36_02605 [Clostridia bacterium]|nr:hypothetical protein [Clostridia bacterium]
MKKRMFFTSIIMILLLLVAVSTATFAWFSASNVVNVSVISFKASSSHKGEQQHTEGLAISWTPDGVDSYEIDFASNKDMRPMMPKNKPEIGESYESFMNIAEDESNFYSASQSYDTDGGYYFYSGVVRAESPTVCKSADGDEEFYLINKTAEFAQRITVKYEIDGENTDALCVALFVDGELAGIMGGSDKLYYGEIVIGERIDSQSFAETVSKTEEITFIIPKGESVKIRLVAWYSGVDIDNNDAQKTAMLSSLQFVGDYVG